jgi:phage baseplate assembly protein W
MVDTHYRGFVFPFRKGKTALPDPLSDAELIKQSVMAVIQTPLGSRVMRPDFGSNVMAYVFESNTQAMGQMLAYEVRRALETWEPRVKVTSVETAHYPEQGKVVVTISYYVPSLQKADSVDVPVSA